MPEGEPMTRAEHLALDELKKWAEKEANRRACLGENPGKGEFKARDALFTAARRLKPP